MKEHCFGSSSGFTPPARDLGIKWPVRIDDFVLTVCKQKPPVVVRESPRSQAPVTRSAFRLPISRGMSANARVSTLAACCPPPPESPRPVPAPSWFA
ncbi:jg18455 [Pararge aegeria aegeria]|uniref:Jg18455 protein n=1 Tax=Pararge aegeria aegeria TaxID=348720 RepID=A0A8S4RPN4_9NEOP|nr:jg18455 [Pararge aegeria aegeria]